MHLHSLTLTNLRQFKQRTFVFQPGFNLLVGENGAGKTTLLRGLLAALGSAQQTGRRLRLDDDDIRLREHHAEACATIRSSSDEFFRFSVEKRLWEPAIRSTHRDKIPLVLMYSSNEAVCSSLRGKRARREAEVERSFSRTSEEFLYSIDRGSYDGPGAAGRHRFGSSRAVKQFVERALHTFSADMVEFYWRFEPYECSIVSTKGVAAGKYLDPKTTKRARAFVMRKLREGEWRRKRRYSWPDWAKVTLYPEGSARANEHKRLPRLHEIWDGMEFSSEAERDFILSSPLEVKLTPRIMIKRGIGDLSLGQLSDGEQRLFSLFVDIARQLLMSPRYDEFAKGRAIILIDEIDVHLHPKWQRRIVPALESLFPNCQFLATTHSPFVIQAVGRDRITFIDSQDVHGNLGGGNSLEDIAENIQGISQPQRSLRAQQLSAAAEHYFTLLDIVEKDAEKVSSSELRAAERKYRAASEPFTSDPALHALLKVLIRER